MALDIISTINLDLKRPNTETVYAVQYDTAGRIKAQLTNDGEAWHVPSSAGGMVSFRKSDNIGGFYDTTELGEVAVSVDENDDSIIYIALDAQTTITATPLDHPVQMQINFYNSQGKRLSTFAFYLRVQASVLFDGDQDERPVASEWTFRILTGALGQTIKNQEDAIKWMADNIRTQAGYVVDDTLKVPGAAGDAKRIGELFEEIVKISDSMPGYFPTTDTARVGSTKYYTRSGTAPNYVYTEFTGATFATGVTYYEYSPWNRIWIDPDDNDVAIPTMDELDEVKSALKVLGDDEVEVDFSNATLYNIAISSSSGKWIANYESYIIPIGTVKNIKIVANDQQNAFYALLETNSHVAGEVPSYIPGSTRTRLDSGNEITIDVPIGCEYIYIEKSSSLIDRTPSKVVLYSKAYYIFENIDLLETNVDDIYHTLHEVENLDIAWVDSQRVSVSSSTEKIQINSNANYKYGVISVSPGETYLISTNVNSSNYPGIRFASVDNDFISNDLSDIKQYTDEEIIVPDNNVALMYVNYYKSEAVLPFVKRKHNDIKELHAELQIQENRVSVLEQTVLTGTVNSIVLASVNCGTFDHNHDDTFPTDPDYSFYTNEWRQMINKTSFDIFALEDFTANFDKNGMIDAQTNLFATMIKSYIDKDHGLRIETKIPCEDLGLLEVVGSSTNPFVYNSTNYTSGRRYAQKTRVYIDGHEVVIYSLHFVPGTTGGYPGAFRHQQFEELIEDAKQYECTVFIGDFNCHQISEYNIFTENNYVICNGGYLGDFLTLRDAYADNIIVTPNLCADNFTVVDEYDLSTDHYPVMATIRYIG